MANRHFAGEDPIGRRIRFVPRGETSALDTDAAFTQSWRTIVGVSAPFLQGSSDDAFRSPVVYLPLRQSAPRTASVVIRSALPPGTIMTAVRGAVQSIDADQPVFKIETIAAVLENERLIYRIFSTLFGMLASIGLILSAVGVYGVMAYAVTQRTQEIGVRMAIGAKRWDVSWLFLKRGLVQLAAGARHRTAGRPWSRLGRALPARRDRTERSGHDDRHHRRHHRRRADRVHRAGPQRRRGSIR